MFICTCNKTLKDKIKRKNHSWWCQKSEILRNKFNELENLYSGNHRKFLKEIKDYINKWKSDVCAWIRRLSIVKRAMFPKAKSESESLLAFSDFLWPHALYSPWNSPGQNTGVGSLSLLQEIFPIQRSNPGLPHYRQILYQLRHQGNPRILERSFFIGSSRPRNQTGVSCIAGRFFTCWATREALMFPKLIYNFNTILIRFTAGVICRIDKVFLEFMWNCRNSKWSK